MKTTWKNVLSAALVILAPGCVPEVDLGGSPDAGSTPGSDAGPSVDAGPTALDAGPGTDAGTGGGAVTLRAAQMLIDVFDGSSSTLSFELRVTIDDTSSTPHDVRPQRYEILASDGSVAITYPLSGAALALGSSGSAQIYDSFEVAPVATVAAPLSTACAGDDVRSRLLNETIRVVVSVDGADVSHEQTVPAGTGGTPPLRPFVLCHEGLTVERSYPGFEDAFLGFTLRPDGLYDVELWENAGGPTWTHAPVRSVDPTVRISPLMGRHYPSIFPVFTTTMDVACASCGLGGALDRFSAGSPAVPMRIPSTDMPYWCAAPAPGQDDGTGPWPPSTPGSGSWGCRYEGPDLTGDGSGIASFSGTTDAGPFRAEMFVFGGNWYYADTRFP